MTGNHAFFTNIDRTRYLQELHELSLKLRIAVHAYVLTTSHVHLLLTSQQAGMMPTLMHSLGRHYGRDSCHPSQTAAPTCAGQQSPSLGPLSAGSAVVSAPLRGCKQPKAKLTGGKCTLSPVSDPCFPNRDGMSD